MKHFLSAAAAAACLSASQSVALDTSWTPLHRAVSEDNFLMARLVIETGAGVDVDAKTDDGWTPLHIAAALSVSPDIVKLLIDNGADVNAEALYGWTPLHFAARSDSLPIAQLLIDKGADVNAKTNSITFGPNRNGQIASLDGSTPLYFAALADSLPMAKLLIDNGADVDVPSLVLARGNPAMERLLLGDNFSNIIGAAAKAVDGANEIYGVDGIFDEIYGAD